MSMKTTKKVLCTIMSLILLATCIVPAFAQAKKCNCGNNPLLIISGFSEFDLVNKNTGETVWIPEASAITKAVEQAMPSLTKLLASQKTQSDYDTFCDSFLPIVTKLFDPISCSPNGDPKYSNVGLVQQFTESVATYGIDTVTAAPVFDKDIVKSACNAVGEDHVYVYGLDWRVDPLVLADEIHAYVQHIKEVSGHDKISISGISMGGVVMSAYLAKYPEEVKSSISNITMISSAWTGVEMVGQLFTGNIDIDTDGLYRIITEASGKSQISDVLEKTGIVNKLLPIVSDLLKCEKDRIYTECLIPSFGYNTGIWDFVPESYYAQAKSYMNARMNDGTQADTTEFWNRVDYYHNNVENQMKTIMNQAKADGIFVGVVSNYNSQIAPVTPSSNLSSDQVIETVHTSGYATVASLGKTLPSTLKHTSASVSPDGMINSSTCYLPENTWFIKNQTHVQFSESTYSDNGAFYAWLLTAKKQYDVNTDTKYPQYLIYDKQTKVLSPLSVIDGDATTDGKLSILDAKTILKAVSGSQTLGSEQSWASDMNCDGKVTIVDAKATLQAIAAK